MTYVEGPRYALSELLTASDVAEILGVSRGAVSNWHKRGTGLQPVGHVGTAPVYLRSQLLDHVANLAAEIVARLDAKTGGEQA